MSLNTGPGGKGPGSDASMITAMRKAAVDVNYQYTATAKNTIPNIGKFGITDKPMTRGFTDSPYTHVFVSRGLFNNFLKTL